MSSRISGKGMSHRVALYVPSTQNVREVLDASTAGKVVENALRFLSSLFGGATAVPATGGWVADDDTLVTESVTIVYSFAAQISSEQLQAVEAYVIDLKIRLKQESVAVEIDGTLYLL